jgi:sugar fermentation stimulation protein A
MRFPTPLTEARLIRRYKRFLADVEFADGAVETVHVANPGSMIGLTAEGSRVYISRAANPARKLPWSLELIEADGTLVGINTAHPNRLVADAITDGTIAELAGYGGLRREVAYGKNSRIDMLLSGGPRPDAYVEVKNVHLSRRPPRAEFPDSVTARGAKHLDELSAMVKAGARGVMVYLVHRADSVDFALARDLDPTYAAAFDRARAAGVEILVYGCRVTPEEVAVAGRLPLRD